MRILAMDTSAGACSVALRDDRGVIERLEEMQRGHAEALMPMIVSLMRAAGCAFRELGLVAVTIGPGAFTGLRVGLAAARGIALAADLPCFGVTTLEAIAEAIDWPTLAQRPVLVALDTRHGEFYAQLFEAGQALEPPSVQSVKSISVRLAGAPAAIAGDGSPMLALALRELGLDADEIDVAPYPMASRVASIAGRRWLAGEKPERQPAPLYLQPPATGPRQARAAVG